jgi:hypothetical protein
MQMTENLLEKVTMGEPLWEVHCGFAPAPTAYQFGLWLKRWTLRELEYALDRAAVKFRHQIMDAATVSYAELMSGRVIVATLHDRAVFPYQHDYSVQKLGHDGRFYVAHLGTWELIPGQPAPPSPPQKPPDISYDWQGDEIDIALAQWTPPEPPAPSPEPEPTFSWERIRELRKRLAELNGKGS